MVPHSIPKFFPSAEFLPTCKVPIQPRKDICIDHITIGFIQNLMPISRIKFDLHILNAGIFILLAGPASRFFHYFQQDHLHRQRKTVADFLESAEYEPDSEYIVSHETSGNNRLP